MSRRIAILGSTGSVGAQTLDVIRSISEKESLFEIVALSAGKNIGLLVQQIKEFSPGWVAIQDELDREKVEKHKQNLRTYSGINGLQTLLKECNADLVVNGLVGAAGLIPTLTALELGADVALANKESLVIGGHLVQKALQSSQAKLIPVDSEHSAIFQLLEKKEPPEVSRILLTASGGSLREWPLDKIDRVTPEDVLQHPTWQMGRRITVDSATLVNKAFEVIEAHWLFNLAWEKIDVVLHPQSIIHGLLEFCDGSLWAQLGAPDMRIPIQYALTYPERKPSSFEKLDWRKLELQFSQIDRKRYPAFDVVVEAGLIGGTAPAAINAADEVAVERFLSGEIPYSFISTILRTTLERHALIKNPDLAQILDADRMAREFAHSL
ncbi:1-deoxy-D-xylulose-5-phosphate reductoisomerase [Candidatus Acetothermia bacterium]|nr:1-deoxy-D-xylulose-5-phosphate reductoisomerase [Candidatus Acetothermia bacterium]MBI3644023.1 1-deoxy-D-xylulose-5-phosphate reductoisomerase [Candidatus Acetothermia bacterium]